VGDRDLTRPSQLPPDRAARPAPRAIGVVTTARSDYGIYLPILRQLDRDPDVRLLLIAGGMHLSPEHGMTVRDIERDGFAIAERVELLLSSATAEGIATSLGLAVIGFARAFTRARPDILVLLGDRFEMFAAAAAAATLRIPVAHVHGGEATIGALDESFRHAITKLSHLHFPAAQAYADRIVQMGESPWRVVVSGAPALDDLRDLPPPDAAAFERAFHVPLTPAPLLVTYHPVTLELSSLSMQLDALFGALDDVGLPVIVTDANADEGGDVIRQRVASFAESRPHVHRVANFGRQGYFEAMRLAAAMVGNSSSGIIEAASFGLPVVNIGSRQAGRLRGANVIDVGAERAAIAAAIRRAVSPDFGERLRGARNPYDRGGAARLIVERLKAVALDENLLRKTFHDLPATAPVEAAQ
jgi:UDP-hydrolysing UDP-N-acetyl-D-glucosamine 2-epimerase